MIATRRKHRIATALLAGLFVLPALVACTGKGGAHAGASPTPSMTDAQIQTLVNELVQCIRNNGAPGMPDVRVENGTVIPPDQTGVDEATKKNFDSAVQACSAVRDKLPPSVLGEGGKPSAKAGPGPRPQDVPALRKFAECMRNNGVPEFPDPKADGSFPLAGSPLETEGKSPRIVNGFQACKQYWDGGLTFS